MLRIGTRITLMPQYMRHFTCVGGECEDSCCIGWRVDIDEKTYKKYRRLNHLELTPLLELMVYFSVEFLNAITAQLLINFL